MPPQVDVAPDDATRDTVTADVQAFIQQALQRWKLADESERENRTEGLVDQLMVDGQGQWDPEATEMRRQDKRPCLTINRFIPMIAYVANEQRQMRVGALVHPVGSGADVDGAQVRQGLIRAIENESHAETIYDTAFESMLEKGWSWFRIVSEFESETSFRRVLKIKGFVNDFSVYCDPSAQEPTRRDMDWAFITEDIPRGEYRSLYPKSRAISLSHMQGIGDSTADWLTSDAVRVAEYYYADYEPATLIQLVDGTGRWKKELHEQDGVYYDKATMDVVPVAFNGKKVVSRQSRKRTIKWVKINAVEILEGNDDASGGRDMQATWIPLIMVAGRQRNINGKTRLSGMVRHNREPQRIYNYLVSQFVEAVALAPKAPFVVAAGQIENYKPIWDSANQKNHPYLPYDPMTKDLQPVPAPQRQTLEPAVQAVGAGIIQFDNIIKAGFNIYDSALGKRGSQESGKAMLLGKTQSESANMNWIDNLSRAIQHAGEVLLDLIPSRYDSARVLNIVRPDNERQEILINQMFTDKDGSPQFLDMARGKYSCTVTAGLTNVTKRQQSLQSMFGLMEADPGLFRVIGDLVMKNMDWEGADLIGERLKKALPPEYQEGGQQIPPEVQQQMQQMMMEHQKLLQEFQDAQRTIDSKEIETAGKLEVAKLQAQAMMSVAAAKFKTAADMKELEIEFKRIAELLKDNRERQALRQKRLEPARS